MAIITLRPFQQQAVDSAVAVFDHMRSILDTAGMFDTKIFASGDLNEYKIADLISCGSKIDAFGVGTELATSHDAPSLGGVYKLAGLDKDGYFTGRIKLSHDKATYPGTKQVWRMTDGTGGYARDMIALADEERPGENWRPTLEQVMTQGRVAEEFASKDRGSEQLAGLSRASRFARLKRARDRAAQELERFPENLTALDATAEYRVDFSERLTAERENLERKIFQSQS